MTRGISRREFLAKTGAAAVGLPLLHSHAARADDKATRPDQSSGAVRPNVLVIMCDQLSTHALSCYGGAVETPNIDRIASGGVLFNNATCPTPVCSPSRASFVTGLYPHTHGITMNIANVNGIGDDEVTTDKLLHDSGYDTYHCGKWHLENKKKLPSYYPESYRYDYEWRQDMQKQFDEIRKGDPWTYMDHYGLILPVEIEPSYLKLAQSVAPKWKGVAPGPFYELALKMGRLKLEHKQHPDVCVVDRTIAKLASLKGDKPFSMTCSIQAPHDPNVIQSPYYEMFDPKKLELPANRDVREARFDDREWRCPARKIVADLGEPGVREFTRIYYATVKMIDDEVGRLLDALDKAGRAADTIVIFTADHGDMLGGHGMVTKSTDAFYDEIVRIPLVIRYPNGIKPGESTAPVCVTDVMPTVLELTGQKIPSNVQGLSLASLMQKKPSAVDSRQFTFSERVANNPDHSRKVAPGTAASFMIRGQGWKYARFYNHDEHLFNIGEDPQETKNLAQDTKHAEKRKWLSSELDTWLEKTGFPRAQ